MTKKIQSGISILEFQDEISLKLLEHFGSSKSNGQARGISLQLEIEEDISQKEDKQSQDLATIHNPLISKLLLTGDPEQPAEYGIFSDETVSKFETSMKLFKEGEINKANDIFPTDYINFFLSIYNQYKSALANHPVEAIRLLLHVLLGRHWEKKTYPVSFNPEKLDFLSLLDDFEFSATFYDQFVSAFCELLLIEKKFVPESKFEPVGDKLFKLLQESQKEKPVSKIFVRKANSLITDIEFVDLFSNLDRYLNLRDKNARRRTQVTRSRKLKFYIIIYQSFLYESDSDHIQCLVNLVRQNTEEPELLIEAARYCLSKGAPDNARSILLALLECFANDQNSCGEALYHLSSINKQRGEFETAIDGFKKFLASESKFKRVAEANANFHLGDILFKQKNYAEAERYLKQCLALNENFLAAKDLLNEIKAGGLN
jgi:hypothetical protein